MSTLTFSASEKVLAESLWKLFENFENIPCKGFIITGAEGSGKTFIINNFITECKQNFIRVYDIFNLTDKNTENILYSLADSREKAVLRIYSVETLNSAEFLRFINTSGLRQNVMIIGECRDFGKINPAISSFFIPLVLNLPTEDDVYLFLLNKCNKASRSFSGSLYYSSGVNNYYKLNSVAFMYNTFDLNADVQTEKYAYGFNESGAENPLKPVDSIKITKKIPEKPVVEQKFTVPTEKIKSPSTNLSTQQKDDLANMIASNFNPELDFG